MLLMESIGWKIRLQVEEIRLLSMSHLQIVPSARLFSKRCYTGNPDCSQTLQSQIHM